MEDVREAILRAWETVRPILEKDENELAQRLARRRQKEMLKPPREACVAIRACDQRITSEATRIEPLRAERLQVEHRVVIDARLLYRLCRPKWIEPGGGDVLEIAERLGLRLMRSGRPSHTRCTKGAPPSGT